MTFGILKPNGTVDKTKTNKLKRQIKKSCEKIRKTIYEEVKKVQDIPRGETLSSHFWGSVSHNAFLQFSQNDEDVYIGAEIADLFGSTDLRDPTYNMSQVDIDRLDRARKRELEKIKSRENKKEKK